MRERRFGALLFIAVFAPAIPLPAQDGRRPDEGPAGTAREADSPRAEASLDGAAADEISPDEIRWFRSNASGIALESVPSRLAALRNGYCLSVETAAPGDLPEILSPYYEASFRIELRTLYENGGPFRRQWIFRDSGGLARLAASGNGAFWESAPATAPPADSLPADGGETPAEEAGTGFIEIRNGAGALEREIRYEDDLSEWEYRFFYNKDVLLRAESWFKKPEDPGGGFVKTTTDYYRYSRFGSLRAIDRAVHAASEGTARVSFPRIGRVFPSDQGLVSQGMAYTPEFFQDIQSQEGAGISYKLDGRSRLLGETWKNEAGEVVGEFQYTWSEDKLMSVLWKSAGDERLVEYEYDAAGNRVVERNLRQGVLERTVTSRDGREIEEIYMNGRVILRALWERGLKISEERVRGSGKGPGPAEGREEGPR